MRGRQYFEEKISILEKKTGKFYDKGRGFQYLIEHNTSNFTSRGRVGFLEGCGGAQWLTFLIKNTRLDTSL